jgi:nucleoside-diphosphate-sugar epimerase
VTILVTGASGFVGSALVKRLTADNPSIGVAVAVRRSDVAVPNSVQSIHTGDLPPITNWVKSLQGVSVVVHCAARVHLISDSSSDPLADFRRVNVEGTATLARQAAVAGVRRFVFLSSIKVNGEFTELGAPFTADDVPSPKDPYGISKHEAEKLLRLIACETGMEVVIIRPPLVYGPGVKANFQSIMRWLTRGVPLPLAAVTENRRSLVALDNMVDLIATCLTHPAAANQTFLVSDGEDLSTAELFRRMGEAQGSPARLFYAPVSVLELGAAMLGKRSIYQRLCGSLQVDIGKTRELLSWAPPVKVDEGLRRAAAGFRA